MKEKPVVAIQCITYNHEAYIRDALEGFVMQKTDFPFVAIVHDDASTDSTADIIREYAERYPDIIKPIYETENQYSKRDGSLGRIMRKAISETGAEFVALCEGDDYWTDPLKLQKQVDFLRSHPDYSIVSCNSSIKNETDYNFTSVELEEKEYSSDEVLLGYRLYTSSIVIRYEAMRPNKEQIIYGDMWIILCGLDHGKCYAFKDYMSVYRRNYGGVSVSGRYDNGKERISYQKYFLYVNKKIKEIFPKVSKRAYNVLQARIFWGFIFEKNEKIFYRGIYALKALFYSPSYFFRQTWEIIKRKLL